jgi:histidine triad (HIT) family protein
MDCIFCKIANKEIPGKIVYEDNATIAFLDVVPRAPGHTVVILKRHAASIVELSDEEVGRLFASVKKVDSLLLEKLQPDGLTIGINQGGEGQEVFHIHVHLMPRYNQDGGGAIQSIVSLKDEGKRREAEGKLGF